MARASISIAKGKGSNKRFKAIYRAKSTISNKTTTRANTSLTER